MPWPACWRRKSIFKFTGQRLATFAIVGLADTEVKGSRDRRRAAITDAGFELPQHRMTVNLAPADLPKESGRFDLPIAIGIMAASGRIPSSTLKQFECSVPPVLGLDADASGAQSSALQVASRIDDASASHYARLAADGTNAPSV